jgi:predicted extracellular nuclease
MKICIKKRLVFWVLLTIHASILKGQEGLITLPEPFVFRDDFRGDAAIRVMFYNVENLFDTFNDSLKNDESFTPEGNHHWTEFRYNKKLKSLSKVILAAGGWEAPEIIGLCEIENRFVLDQLVQKTGLRNIGYQIIHEESPDRRGIDVAMMYRPNKFTPINHQAINITFPFDPGSKTRDILYVRGLVGDQDTVHLFVNHWPSKFGGAKETEPKRMFVAKLLRNKVDSIFALNADANIVIMGDLNDEPTDESVMKGLKPETDLSKLKRNNQLFNLMYAIRHKGSHKYQDSWSTIDQFIVSGGLMLRTEGLRVAPEKAVIFEADFLLEVDERNMGKKPFRTYIGMKYHGGYADHLPIYVDLLLK